MLKSSWQSFRKCWSVVSESSDLKLHCSDVRCNSSNKPIKGLSLYRLAIRRLTEGKNRGRNSTNVEIIQLRLSDVPQSPFVNILLMFRLEYFYGACGIYL